MRVNFTNKLSIILLMLIGTMSSAWAQKAPIPNSDLTWELTGTAPDLTLTISGTGEMPDFFVLDEDDRPWSDDLSDITTIIVDDGVTSIGNVAFDYCTNLTSVTLPNSLKSLGDYAFSGCSSLKSITLPNSLTSIGGFVFAHCTSLESITLPDGLTNIGHYAFAQCTSLTSVTLPNDLTSIDGFVFHNCSSLKSITLPDGLTSINHNAFARCFSLTSITLQSTVPPVLGLSVFDDTPLSQVIVPLGSIDAYKVHPDWSAYKDIIILPGETIIPGSTLKWKLTGSAPDLTLTISDTGEMPDFVDFFGNDIPWHSDQSDIKTIIVGDGVTSIGRSAFISCSNLTSVTLPDGLTSIGDEAFALCSSLESITLPDGLMSIGDIAFFGCSSLKSITLQSTAPPSLGTDVFYDAPLSQVIVPLGSIDAYKAHPDWSAYISIMSTVGIEQVSGNKFIAYPNPTYDMVTVTGITAGQQIRIYTITGTRVATHTATTDGNMQIDLSALPQGTYILQTGTATVKVVRK